MRITIKAHFDGKTFVPDEPVHFPANFAVTLKVDPAVSEPQWPAEIEQRLKALDDLEKMALEADSPAADWSRESIYSGTVDDPR